jgi:hypothetical protein
MITKTTTAELKLKDGTVYPIGTTFELRWDKERYGTTFATTAGREVKLGTARLHKYFNVSKPPTVNTLMKWEFDSGTCKTVLGKKTEPDGTDEYGSPSWMLVMGVI